MGRRAVRVGLVGASLVATTLVPAWASAAPATVRTCNVPSIAHERTLPAHQGSAEGLGADLPAPVTAPLDLPAGATPLPDLDFDGRPDHLGGDGRREVGLTTTSAPTPLRPTSRGPVADSPIRATRAGTTTRLITVGTDSSVEVWTVRNHCARAWLGRASRWVLGVQPTDDGLLGRLDPVAPLTAGQRRSLARTLVHSEAARTALVDQRYHAVLHRDAEPGALRSWVTALRAGDRTPEDLTASLFSSEEFWTTRGATLDGWVTGLYRQTVGHAPDPAGRAHWAEQARRHGREAAATRFLATPAARRALVASTYQGEFVMGRAVDPGGLERGADLLARGGWDALQIELLASDEFYLSAQRSNRLRPL